MTGTRWRRATPLERVALPAAVRGYARAFLMTIVVLVAAALGDVGVEAAIRIGFFGGGYVDRSHQTIVPVAVLAAALLLLALAWTRMDARYDARWLVTVARDAARAGFSPSVATGALLAMLVSLALEQAEQALGGGLPFGGLPPLGPAGPAIAAIFGLSAALVVALLAAAMRGVLAAFDFVARALASALVWLLDRVLAPHSAANVLLYAGPECRASSVALRRRHGERAPPHAFS